MYSSRRSLYLYSRWSSVSIISRLAIGSPVASRSRSRQCARTGRGGSLQRDIAPLYEISPPVRTNSAKRAACSRHPSAGAVLIEAWRESVPAVLMAWYSGMEGGHALADVLLGHVDATGRLPFSIPPTRRTCRRSTATPPRSPTTAGTAKRLLDRLGVPAAYPLGSACPTRLRLYGAAAEQDGPNTLRVSTTVRNTGDRDGRHVVQVYGVRLAGDRAGERALLGFAPASVPAGGSQDVTVPASLRPLGRWNASTRRLHIPAGHIRVEVAAWSGDPHRRETEVILD
jgi:beta-glucosidase